MLGKGASRNRPSRRLRKVDYEALAAFRRALRRFLALSAAAARGIGMTPQQHQCVLAIRGQRDRNWATISEIADALQIRHHAAVGLVDRAERKGWVKRQLDPKDRRQVRVTVTRRGERALDRLTEGNRRELLALQRALRLPFLGEAENSSRSSGR